MPNGMALLEYAWKGSYFRRSDYALYSIEIEIVSRHSENGTTLVCVLPILVQQKNQKRRCWFIPDDGVAATRVCPVLVIRTYFLGWDHGSRLLTFSPAAAGNTRILSCPVLSCPVRIGTTKQTCVTDMTGLLQQTRNGQSAPTCHGFWFKNRDGDVLGTIIQGIDQLIAERMLWWMGSDRIGSWMHHGL